MHQPTGQHFVLFSSNVLYPRALLKTATGCLVITTTTSAQFVENYTLDQFDGNYTLENLLIVLSYGGIIAFFHILIPLHGVSKHLRQRKLARSKRSFSDDGLNFEGTHK